METKEQRMERIEYSLAESKADLEIEGFKVDDEIVEETRQCLMENGNLEELIAETVKKYKRS